MAGWILLAATGGMAAIASYAFLGAYWQLWRHRHRGHDWEWIGDWANQEHYLCSCGEYFSNWYPK